MRFSAMAIGTVSAGPRSSRRSGSGGGRPPALAQGSHGQPRRDSGRAGFGADVPQALGGACGGIESSAIRCTSARAALRASRQARSQSVQRIGIEGIS